MRQRDPGLEPEPDAEPAPPVAVDPVPEPDAGFEEEPPGFNFDVLIGEPDEPAVVTPTRVTPQPIPIGDRRRILWRDSATILVFVVLALLGAQLFLPRGTGGPSDTSIPSGINIGSLPPGMTLAPGMTLGPIVDPSLGIDATPTPIPAITLGPSQTPGPTPRPAQTPKPTVKPTPTHPPTTPPTLPPTPPPTQPPTAPPTAPPTPAPPVAGFSWSQTSPTSDLTIDFTNTSSGETSWDWDFGDGTAHGTTQNPTHIYSLPGMYDVKLTVTGPGGTDSTPFIQITVDP